MSAPMTSEQIAEVLDKHGKWLLGEEGGERANLRGAYMRCADLIGADLRGASLPRDCTSEQLELCDPCREPTCFQGHEMPVPRPGGAR